MQYQRYTWFQLWNSTLSDASAEWMPSGCPTMSGMPVTAREAEISSCATQMLDIQLLEALNVPSKSADWMADGSPTRLCPDWPPPALGDVNANDCN